MLPPPPPPLPSSEQGLTIVGSGPHGWSGKLGVQGVIQLDGDGEGEGDGDGPGPGSGEGSVGVGVTGSHCGNSSLGYGEYPG